MAQIDQREVREFQMVGDLEAECACIEIQRLRFVEDADHGVDRFRHQLSPFKYAMIAARVSGLACR